MYKKTSTVIGLAIATILTAYVSTLTLSNQAFAQHTQIHGPTMLLASQQQAHIASAIKLINSIGPNIIHITQQQQAHIASAIKLINSIRR
jgi:hypothetical protein